MFDSPVFTDPRIFWVVATMLCVVVIAAILVFDLVNRRRLESAKCAESCSYCTGDPVNTDEVSPRSRARIALFHLEFALIRKDTAGVHRALHEIDQSAMQLAHAAGCAEGEQAFEDFAKAAHAYAEGSGAKPHFPGGPVPRISA